MPPGLSIEKVIEPGSYRFLGLRVQGVDPGAIPIAGKSRGAILKHLKGTAFGVGRTRLHNAFVVEVGVLRLLYVRPQYSGYRTVAKRVFLDALHKVEYDHTLGKSLGSRLGYSYVLVTRIGPSANRSHGVHEKVLGSLHSPTLCFFDRRIKAKMHGKNSRYAASFEPLEPFNASNPAHGGLTLKQLGQWAYAVGVEDFPFSCLALVCLSKARL